MKNIFSRWVVMAGLIISALNSCTPVNNAVEHRSNTIPIFHSEKWDLLIQNDRLRTKSSFRIVANGILKQATPRSGGGLEIDAYGERFAAPPIDDLQYIELLVSDSNGIGFYGVTPNTKVFGIFLDISMRGKVGYLGCVFTEWSDTATNLRGTLSEGISAPSGVKIEPVGSCELSR